MEAVVDVTDRHKYRQVTMLHENKIERFRGKRRNEKDVF